MRNWLVILLAVSALGCAARLETLLPKAEAGDAEAQLKIGRIYQAGKQVEADPSVAVEWIRKAAEQGNAEAESLMGFAYEHGEGVEADFLTALDWHKKAAKQGIVASYASVGSCYLYCKLLDPKPHAGVTWLRKGAIAGEVNAQAALGRLYLWGWGRVTIDSNNTLAEKWLKAAAKQGRPQDQYNYAEMYYDKEVYSKIMLDPLKDSVAQDFPKAIVLLASMHREGKGLPVDHDKAVELLNRAAVSEYPPAIHDLGIAYLEGNGVEQDVDGSFRRFTKAAEMGYVDAQRYIALAYLDGVGVEKDTVLGYAWLRVCTAQSDRKSAKERGVRNDEINGTEFKQAKGMAEDILANLPDTWSEE
jgi:hypothetical protein